ncbi:hypothetical protein BMS3Abin06_01853 [bacterium BMS3Abin06]|nr:hypothetical protein BMS3Abin06_01853 [bacterium BMS3Abin06]
MRKSASDSNANVGAIHELPLREALPEGWEKVPFVSAVKVLSKAKSQLLIKVKTLLVAILMMKTWRSKEIYQLLFLVTIQEA